MSNLLFVAALCVIGGVVYFRRDERFMAMVMALLFVYFVIAAIGRAST